MSQLCWPWWDSFFRSIPEIRINKAGCGVIDDSDAAAVAIAQAFGCITSCAGEPTSAMSGKGNNGVFGWVNCAPEVLRAHAQAEMERMGYWKGHLPLETYGLARNSATEFGDGKQEYESPEAKISLMLSTVAQARRRGTPIMDVLLGAGSGLPRKFGRIQGVINSQFPRSSCGEVCTRPGRRFTATSQNPSVRDILMADFVLAGKAGTPGSGRDFARGAEDQAQANAVGVDGVLRHAQSRKYWVGQIPGVDPAKQMFFRTISGVAPTSAEGRVLIAAGQAVARGEISGVFNPGCIESKPNNALRAVGAVFGTIAVSVGIGLLAPRFFPTQIASNVRRL